MEFERNIAPPPARKKVEVEPEAPRQTRVGGKSFSEALAAVEGHRDRVQATLAIAGIARLIGDFDLILLFKNLVRAPNLLVVQLPFIGLAVLSYMIVLWFLAARTRDRWGFGMALGIGVLQATYTIVRMIQLHQFAPSEAWKPAVAALSHLALAFMAFRAGGAYPALDSKKPWILGFATAFIFVTIPWVAVPLSEALGWGLG